MSGCDRSEIERMKEERRVAAAAKRAAAPEKETATAEATPPPAAAAAPPGPLKQLTDAEAKADKIDADMVAITAEAIAAADTEALDAASKRAAAIGGAIGGLQGMMDEIDLGELDDEARAAARQRRKAINARVEGKLEPAARALKEHVRAQRARLA